ncbi:hypothetical protein FPV67DRAFT_1467513 [Lyophyllum atratum]|nr:hypothetical protein FPV67DRAFT_1467513 [Lyophyllum atratum]
MPEAYLAKSHEPNRLSVASGFREWLSNHRGRQQKPNPAPSEMDTDILRVWQLVHELSDQLALNQKITATLQAQAGSLKTQASHSGTGFTLRRFNTDISKESFESELERMNAHIIIDNQTLLHENKQLSLLLKEYEGTMETIMAKFRNHALAAQQHELTLTAHYETLLHTRETQSLSSDLVSSTEMSQAIQRLSHHLRGLLRSMAGENFDPSDPIYDGSTNPDDEPRGFVELGELEHLLEALDQKGTFGYFGTEGRADWALEREYEIARLERENEELRRLLGIDEDSAAASGVNEDLERVDSGRYSTFLSSSLRRSTGGTEGFSPQPMYWDNQQQQQPPQQQQQLYPPAPPTAPLQRALDLQQGMRMGTQGQGRRAGIFGAGRGGPRRGGLSGIAVPGWQPAPPAPLVDRPWPGQGGSGLDLTR